MRVVKVHNNRHPHPQGHGISDRMHNKWCVSVLSGVNSLYTPSGPIAFVSRSNPALFKLYFINYAGFQITCHDHAKIYPHIGTFKGKTEVFDAMSYRHLRNHMNDLPPFEEGSLKVGLKGHRISLGNVFNKAKTVMEAVADPEGTLVTKVAQKAVETRYFLALLIDETEMLFNHQTSCIVLPSLTPKKAWTLGDLADKIRVQMDQAFEKEK